MPPDAPMTHPLPLLHPAVIAQHVPPVDARGPDPDQHLVRPDPRPVDIPELEDVHASVPALDVAFIGTSKRVSGPTAQATATASGAVEGRSSGDRQVRRASCCALLEI